MFVHTAGGVAVVLFAPGSTLLPPSPTSTAAAGGVGAVAPELEHALITPKALLPKQPMTIAKRTSLILRKPFRRGDPRAKGARELAPRPARPSVTPAQCAAREKAITSATISLEN